MKHIKINDTAIVLALFLSSMAMSSLYIATKAFALIISEPTTHLTVQNAMLFGTQTSVMVVIFTLSGIILAYQALLLIPKIITPEKESQQKLSVQRVLEHFRSHTFTSIILRAFCVGFLALSVHWVFFALSIVPLIADMWQFIQAQ